MSVSALSEEKNPENAAAYLADLTNPIALVCNPSISFFDAFYGVCKEHDVFQNDAVTKQTGDYVFPYYLDDGA